MNLTFKIKKKPDKMGRINPVSILTLLVKLNYKKVY